MSNLDQTQHVDLWWLSENGMRLFPPFYGTATRKERRVTQSTEKPMWSSFSFEYPPSLHIPIYIMNNNFCEKVRVWVITYQNNTQFKWKILYAFMGVCVSIVGELNHHHTTESTTNETESWFYRSHTSYIQEWRDASVRLLWRHACKSHFRQQIIRKCVIQLADIVLCSVFPRQSPLINNVLSGALFVHTILISTRYLYWNSNKNQDKYTSRLVGCVRNWSGEWLSQTLREKIYM